MLKQWMTPNVKAAKSSIIFITNTKYDNRANLCGVNEKNDAKIYSQLTFACSKSTIEILEKEVKYVQS